MRRQASLHRGQSRTEGKKSTRPPNPSPQKRGGRSSDAIPDGKKDGKGKKKGKAAWPSEEKPVAPWRKKMGLGKRNRVAAGSPRGKKKCPRPRAQRKKGEGGALRISFSAEGKKGTAERRELFAGTVEKTNVLGALPPRPQKEGGKKIPRQQIRRLPGKRGK